MLKGLYDTKAVESPKKKDKLHEAKQNQRDIRDAIKAKKQEAKAQKHEEQLAEANVHRMGRAMNELGTSKRASRDQREEKRHQERKDEGFTCEHGVFKCRICHPVTKHK